MALETFTVRVDDVIYEQGWAARSNRRPLEDNPYDMESTEYQEWIDGWYAHKASEL